MSEKVKVTDSKDGNCWNTTKEGSTKHSWNVKQETVKKGTTEKDNKPSPTEK